MSGPKDDRQHQEDAAQPSTGLGAGIAAGAALLIGAGLLFLTKKGVGRLTSAIDDRKTSQPTPRSDKGDPPAQDQDKVKAALVKEFNRIYLSPLALQLGERSTDILGKYDIGSPVRYDPNGVYDHRTLSNVPPNTDLYPVQANFGLATGHGFQKKLVKFLCYQNSYGELFCTLISDEDI